jgi:hypothetical protein
VDHDLEFARSEHAQVVHGGFDGADGESAFGRDGAIKLKLGVADIDDGDVGAGGGVEGTLPASAGGEAEQVFAADAFREPA